MLCPDDDHALEEIQDWDYPYYKCPHCDGVWIDSTIKDQFFITKTDLNLPDLKSINPQKLLPNEDFKCPKDEGDLFVYNHFGTEIDICEKCGGVWLDYGEKEEIEKRASNV
jgi:Zn-finger nucleic acid-binding protein